MRIENSTYLQTYLYPYFLQIIPPNSLQVCGTPHKIFFSDLCAAQSAIRGGHISCEKTAKKYSDWMSFCTKIHMDHMLENPEDPVIKVLQLFGHRFRHGQYYQICTVSGRTRLLWNGVLFSRLTSWKAAGTLGIRLGPTSGN